MKLSSLIIFLVATFSLLTSAGAQTTPTPPKPPTPSEVESPEEATERITPAEKDVVVSLCLAKGGVVVRGWDRKEVRARSDEAERIELGWAGTMQPTKRVEVLVANDEHSELASGDCRGVGSIELDVPRGATLNLKVQDGDVEISDVAELHIESLNGDVDVQRVSKVTEVSCLSGSISLSDASGNVRLRSINGSVEASDVRTVEASDELSAVSTSGDVTLERIAHAKVRGATIHGRVSMEGPLTRGGNYEFKTTSGDVILELPEDASFNVNARVVASGEIVTDFPVKAKLTISDPGEAHQNRLTGVVGKGDADITLTTFSGTVHLKKH